MTARAEHVLSEALSLPPSERAQLAERLFSSLDISEEELDRLWAQEADSRIDAYNRGDIKAVSANDVFKKISRQPLRACTTFLAGPRAVLLPPIRPQRLPVRIRSFYLGK